MKFESDLELRQFIGENIKAAMADAKMNAAQLSKACGKTNTAVGQWMAGKQVPVMWTAYNVAKILNVTLDQLLFGNKTLAVIDEKGNIIDSFSVPEGGTDNLFAMRVPAGNRTNSPKIDPGDIVVAKRSDCANVDDFVIAELPGSGLAVLRIDQGFGTLKFCTVSGDAPANSKDIIIKGIVTGTYRRF